MDDDRLIDTLTWALDNNYDIILTNTNKINYSDQKLIWSNSNNYYVKNFKIDYAIKEIKQYIYNNKKSFVKIKFNNFLFH